ncbi:hypothetical protein F5Y05DRAFT_387182 [Hypoxylon sp. FL0543]|nr:hypothetical protein F5Y05DRAFT_387182 [Hypoxylon sp. FL0543]
MMQGWHLSAGLTHCFSFSVPSLSRATTFERKVWKSGVSALCCCLIAPNWKHPRIVAWVAFFGRRWFGERSSTRQIAAELRSTGSR